MLDFHLSSCKTKKKKESTSVLTCHICNKKCLSEKSLKRHGYKIHGKFNCPECGEVFSSRSKFDRHKMKTHRNSTFPCSQCEMSFLLSSASFVMSKPSTKEFKISNVRFVERDSIKLVT